MKVGFSELQFAYGCTSEIEDGCLFAGIGVPYFPSLVDEAKKGYDVKIPTLLVSNFLQYKELVYLMLHVFSFKIHTISRIFRKRA